MSLIPSRSVTHRTPVWAMTSRSKPLLRVRAGDVLAEPVPADALVDHRDRLAPVPGPEAVGQEVRPAMVGVHGRGEAVGDGVSERHHRAALLRSSSTSTSESTIPGRAVCSPPGSTRCRGEVAGRRDVVRRHARAAWMVSGPVSGREEDADRDLLSDSTSSFDRVAHRQRPGGDGDRSLAPEGHGPVRAGDDPWPVPWRATWTEPTTSGAVPNRLDRRRRIRSPPRLRRTFSRTVWPSSEGPGSDGLAPQTASHAPRSPSSSALRRPRRTSGRARPREFPARCAWTGAAVRRLSGSSVSPQEGRRERRPAALVPLLGETPQATLPHAAARRRLPGW